MKRRTYPELKSGTPPYRKYQKKPHKYSAAYQAWRRNILNHSTGLAAEDEARREAQRAHRQVRVESAETAKVIVKGKGLPLEDVKMLRWERGEVKDHYANKRGMYVVSVSERLPAKSITLLPGQTVDPIEFFCALAVARQNAENKRNLMEMI